MRAIKVDENRDPILRNGKFEFVYDQEAIMQICDNTMRAQLKEYRYAQGKGIEYLNNVFTGNPNFQMFEIQARNQLTQIDGVNSVTNLDYEQVGNDFNYTALIKTIYGEEQLNVSL
ncbi:hypothetical protein EDB29_1011098 [Vibrio crassostreae]|uniref:hypothetical protein n=1 Tax=Vibrio crassostreae TaxID=246167 RepID=UPI001045433E|nr:hypothetical protein [Vibrio crassostreae]CAH6851471.1 conserved hypothetical protein [Vibrio chagasii]TCT44286.1 hypothetical protein EDB29_1011098 [Vibrio crassostreae]CAH6863066.1 conserved hypothetical protein [Vibrio chagasii]CAH6928887.1 conserved hypothetical protein [Vibrio chagasii]CAH6948348.1 conserved hypothetical protein [Vibrio chagasii]